VRHRFARVLSATALIVVAASIPARPAEDFEVRAYVEPEGRITDTRPLRLVIEVTGSRAVDVSVGKLPDLRNLRVVNGPATARNTQFTMDGLRTRTTASTTLAYTLLPVAPGPAEVPPITVRVGSTSYTTAPIRIEVSRGATAPTPTPPGQRPSREAEEAAGGFDVFLRAEPSTREIYVNQPILLGVTLYTAVPVSAPNWASLPDLHRFWTEDVEVNPDSERFPTTVAGRSYTAFPLLRKLLMPTSAGDVTIDPFVLQLQVRRPSRDLFSQFFSLGGSQTVARKSDPIRIHVRALPEEGRPDDFGGAVGTFRMTAALDRTEARVNDAVALRVTVEGEGSLQSVPAPRWQATSEIKAFDPKVTETKSTAGGKLVSKKVWEWVLVPLVPGDLKLPPLRFAFFDPGQATYRHAEAGSLLLAVRRGEGGGAEVASHGEVSAQIRDIAFLKPLRGPLLGEHARVHRRSWFQAALFLPVLAAPVLVVAGRRRFRLQQDRGLARLRRAGARARKQLRAEGRDLARLDSGTFHERVSRTLLDYVADRFDRSATGLTYDATDDLLAARGVDPALRRRLRSCLEQCDFARFVPGSGEEARKREVLAEAGRIVDDLESVL
jgi:hypothetical protein